MTFLNGKTDLNRRDCDLSGQLGKIKNHFQNGKTDLNRRDCDFSGKSESAVALIGMEKPT